MRKTRRVLDHIGIQVADMERAAAFYDAVLPTLGADRIMDFGQAIGYGIGGKPDFWIGLATKTPLQHEAHVAFEASDREAVDAWFAAAVAAGAEVLHEPRVWPEYHPGYYGAFVRDPDGNNVEAVHHTFESPPGD
jgi:catechol 2,3-dioxygenase-like lactoylglutathione lyase family enzyme